MLETFVALAQIVGSLAVVAAIVFGFAQIRQFRQQRRDVLAVELMRSIQDTEFTRSARMIFTIPPDLSAAEFLALGPDIEHAAWAISAKYETVGYLVYRGIMPTDLAEELLGGIGVHLWQRLRPWVESLREAQGQPLFMEWFQWLVELLQERKRPQAIPAYLRQDGHSMS